jgi:hypothetical protein
VAVLLGPCAVRCGYRPAGAYLEDAAQVSQRARVPAFVSYVGYPELDVFAADYLRMRLSTYGIRAAGDSSQQPVPAIQGTLEQVREVPTALLEGGTLLELELAVHVVVTDPGGSECRTPTVWGRANLAVQLDRLSEGARLLALQSATADAIDQLGLDVLGCLAQGEP